MRIMFSKLDLEPLLSGKCSRVLTGLAGDSALPFTFLFSNSWFEFREIISCGKTLSRQYDAQRRLLLFGGQHT